MNLFNASIMEKLHINFSLFTISSPQLFHLILFSRSIFDILDLVVIIKILE